MVNTTIQSTPILLFFLLFIRTSCKLALTRWFTISVTKANTNSHDRTCDAWTHRRLLPRTTDLHQGTRSAELSEVNGTFGTICCFMSPKPLRVSNTEGWTSSLFRVVCLAALISQPTASACYSMDFRSVISTKNTYLILLRGKFLCSAV
jgi:hypothetical protein